MTRHVAILSLLLSTTALPAWSQEATPEGAARITETLQRYVGTTEGVITVTPEGEAYTLRIDVQPFLAKAIAKGGTATIPPMDFALKDLGDGKWDVSHDAPLAIQGEMPGAIKFDLRSDSHTMHGIFDESLQSFSELTSEMTGMKLDEVVVEPGQTDPAAAPMTLSYAIDKISTTMTGVAGAAGGVDTKLSYLGEGIVENFTLPPSPGMAEPMPIELKAATYTGDMDVKSLQSARLLDLLAWAVAHPDEAAVNADFETLRGKLSAALPVFETLASTGVVNTISVTTPMGGASADKMDVAVEANGIVADGKFREMVHVTGLKLPEAMLPPWSLPLLPNEVKIDFTVDEFDLAAPAALMIAKMQPGQHLSPEDQVAVHAALLPTGKMHITLGPTLVVGGPYKLDAEGDVRPGGAAPIPVGSFLIRAVGIDAALGLLQSAPPEISQRASMMAMMAKGMAKVEGDDSYSWDIQLGEGGQVTVNGNAMPGMGGQ